MLKGLDPRSKLAVRLPGTASTLRPVRKVAGMQSQKPVGRSGVGKAAAGASQGEAAKRLQQLEEEDPSFATLSSPTSGKADESRAPPEEDGQNRPEKAKQHSHTKLEDLVAEDPAFSTLHTEDAQAEASKPPSSATPNGRRNESTSANDGGDTLAQELERLDIREEDSKQDGKEEQESSNAAEPQQSKAAVGREEPPSAESAEKSYHPGLEEIANLIQKGAVKKVIVMTGAGISVSAGIPDFRTPGTGLYDNLQKFKLPYPEAVFSLDYFQVNPKPFYRLAKELFPGSFKPTAAHYFMVLLHRKGLLLRSFTQNIDSLETQAGLPAEKVVAAHGNFDTARCIVCRTEVHQLTVKAAVDAATPCRCPECNGLVKPDIVFFGEALPAVFFQRLKEDFPAADLLVVMGSSLVVQPFATLIGHVEDHVPRLLINRERVAEAHSTIGGFEFDTQQRDFLFEGDCDEGVRQLASLLGWREELEEMITSARSVASPI